MNVAIYARVSSEWQAEHGYSIGTQLEACRKKAKDLGAFVVKEYVDDGYSGGFLERPALEDLRDAVNDGLYEAVICHDADRLSRKLIHQLILTEEFEKHQCKPIFVLGEVTNTPEGQMTYQMKGVFAEYERAKIRERTMRGKRAKLRAGKVINDSHIYGYDFDKASSTYVINPAEAEVIKMIYKLFVEDRVGGCAVVADRLNALKIPSPGGSVWCISTVQGILDRPHYTGHYYSNTYYHKKTGPRTSTKIPRPREEWIPMTCPAIISEDLHKKALAVKATNRTFKSCAVLNDSLLQGLVYCAVCGRRVKLHTSQARWYECSGRRKFGCPARFMKIPIADRLVWSVIARLCASTKSLTDYINSRADAECARTQSTKKRKDITARLDKLRTERKVIMSWFSQSLLNQSDATEKLRALKEEETKLQAELAEAERPAAIDKLEPADICAAVQNCPDDFEAKRKVMLAIVERVNIARHDTRKGTKYDVDLEIIFK